MSKLRRQLSAGITNNVETRNLDDIKGRTGNLYGSIAIIAKRANFIHFQLIDAKHGHNSNLFHTKIHFLPQK